MCLGKCKSNTELLGTFFLCHTWLWVGLKWGGGALESTGGIEKQKVCGKQESGIVSGLSKVYLTCKWLSEEKRKYFYLF